MAEDARFGADAGHQAAERADLYGFFAPVATAAPGTDGMDAPFGAPAPELLGEPVPLPLSVPPPVPPGWGGGGEPPGWVF